MTLNWDPQRARFSAVVCALLHLLQVYVMLAALRAKFRSHPGPKSMLLATRPSTGPAARLVEASPNDFFWGAVRHDNIHTVT